MGDEDDFEKELNSKFDIHIKCKKCGEELSEICLCKLLRFILDHRNCETKKR